MQFVAQVLYYFFQVIIIAIIVSSFLSFFVPPWNPIRRFLDRIIGPLLAPIRRFVPPIGGLDLSPLVLLLLIYIIRSIIFRLLL
jgi:YggT family protein